MGVNLEEALQLPLIRPDYLGKNGKLERNITIYVCLGFSFFCCSPTPSW